MNEIPPSYLLLHNYLLLNLNNNNKQSYIQTKKLTKIISIKMFEIWQKKLSFVTIPYLNGIEYKIYFSLISAKLINVIQNTSVYTILITN